MKKPLFLKTSAGNDDGTGSITDDVVENLASGPWGQDMTPTHKTCCRPGFARSSARATLSAANIVEHPCCATAITSALWRPSTS